MTLSASKQATATLSFTETAICREVFNSRVEENAKTTFDLRGILAELGQFPTEEELSALLRIHKQKISISTFCKYMEYLKHAFISPEPKDIDTVRAFAALGGGLDRTGSVMTDYLRDTCKHFDLRIDIEQMIREVDQDNSGAISFDEFKAMWDHSALDEEDPKAILVRTLSVTIVTPPQATTVDDVESSATLEKKLRTFFFPEPIAPAPNLTPRLTITRRSIGGTLQGPLIPTIKPIKLPVLALLQAKAGSKSARGISSERKKRGASSPGKPRLLVSVRGHR